MIALKIFAALWFFSSISALTSYFLDFALGFPANDRQNTHAIFFKWLVFLSKRRLKMLGTEGVDLLEVLELQQDFEGIVNNAKPYFSFEYMIGFCTVCTNVWITTILYALCAALLPQWCNFYDDTFNGIDTGFGTIFLKLFLCIVFSHYILRKHLLN